jgi:hypothetical protein
MKGDRDAMERNMVKGEERKRRERNRYLDGDREKYPKFSCSDTHKM